MASSITQFFSLDNFKGFKFHIYLAAITVFTVLQPNWVIAQLTPDVNNIIYVNQSVSGGDGSGDSWPNAVPELRDALSWAADNWDGSTDGTLQVWVAKGTYLPTDDGTDREASFTLVDQVEVYGGFAGNETKLEDRDPQANETILSGDIDQNDLDFEHQTDSDGDSSTFTQIDHIVGGNSYSVVYLNEDGVSVHLEGFTVTGGMADVEGSSGRNESDSGGGLFIISNDGTVTMKNLVIEGNYGEEGGGMFNRSGGRFSSIQFEYNVGELGGGLHSSTNLNPRYENLIFRGNHADTGGGMFSNDNSTMVNSLFVENSARLAGGFLVGPGNTTIIGSTFSRNSAEELAGAIRTAREASFINVIIWDNELGGSKDIPEASFSSDINIDISYSIIANSGGSTNWGVSEYADDGGGNLDVDPIFADPENGDYSLSSASPAINSGDNTPFANGEVAEGITTDLAGNPRIYDGDPDPDVVDMGAYEFQGEPFSVGPDDNNVLYVDQNVDAGDGRGSSWDNAIPELRDALSWADENWDGDANGTLQIWVAEGTYTPVVPEDAEGSTGGERDISFQLINNVEIYGGFSGDERERSDRDWKAYETILSGDIDNDDPPFDPDKSAEELFTIQKNNNSDNVVNGNNTSATAILDGFTITGGNHGTDLNFGGGGILIKSGSPTLSHLKIIANDSRSWGGGMLIIGDSRPTLTNISFEKNYLRYGLNNFGGGGLGVGPSLGDSDVPLPRPTLINVSFIENYSDGRYDGGGGILFFGGHLTIINSVFVNNRSRNGGGAIDFVGFSEENELTIVNSTIVGNKTRNSNGGAIRSREYNGQHELQISNSIIWGNSSEEGTASNYPSIRRDNVNPLISHSLIENSGGSGENWNEDYGTDGGNNIDQNPLFVNYSNPRGEDNIFGTNDDALRLVIGSPAINSGDNTVDNLPSTDITGADRIQDGTVDMGSYEGGVVDDALIIYVDKDASGNANGTSWADAYQNLQNALSSATRNDQIWIAEGVYTPGSNEEDSFKVSGYQDGLKIYGGFASGDNFADRNPNDHPVVLSGDIDENDVNENGITQPDGIEGENSNHVFVFNGGNEIGENSPENISNNTLLSGVTVTGGQANESSFPHQSGGGLFCDGRGAGNTCNPTLSDIIFTGNYALDNGGAVYNDAGLEGASSPLIYNTLFRNNIADGDGGAIFNNGDYGDSSPIIFNTTFSGNTAGEEGGAIFNGNFNGGSSSPQLKNTILWDNVAISGGNELYQNIDNAGTPTINNSLIKGSGGSGENWDENLGTDGGNNIDIDPQFLDPDNGDYTLTNKSPAINSGDNTPFESGGVAEGVTTDLAGNARIYDGGTDIVDMGAYEFQDEPLSPPEPIVLTSPEDEAVNVSLFPEFTWEPDETATNYRLIISENSDFSDVFIDESDNVNNNYEPSINLKNSTTYYWKVQGLNEAGSGEWSEVFSFTTLPESSDVVILTDPSDEQDDIPLQPLLEWNSADGADTYDLVVSPNSDFSDPVIEENGITETEFQTVNDLSFSATYYWRARGVNAAGPGEWSEPFSFTTIPEAPAAIVLTFPADEAINVALAPEFTWEADDGADTYQIQVSENSDLSSPVIDESALQNNSFTPASDLANAVTYYWRVRGVNPGGNGSWSEIYSFTTLPESSEIVILTAPSDGAEDISLTPLFEWNPADGADSYDLIVSANSDFSDPVIDKTGITETEFQTVTDLSFSTTYNWRARGRNAAGTGEWSEVFSFTTRDQPEAADNRILVANNKPYRFTPADFGQSDQSAFVIIDNLPADFNGDLTLRGSAVATDDEVSVDDIENGDLIYAPPADVYGFGYDSFEFGIKDDEGNVSGESYAMNMDVAAVQAKLTGSEGWRFMTTPSAGDTYQDLLSGFTAELNYPDRQTLYELDQLNYNWDPVGSLTEEPGLGTPFIVFVEADELPVTVTSGVNWAPLNGTFSFSGLEYNTGAPNPDSFFLLGNPHPVALDFCKFVSDNVAVSINLWDPQAGGGNGDYITQSCALDPEVPIAPFQAFWVRTTEMNPTLEIPETAYLSGTAAGYFKQAEGSMMASAQAPAAESETASEATESAAGAGSNSYTLQLNVTSRDGIFGNTARLLFTRQATPKLDDWDAPKLSARGLAPEWLSFYSMDADDRSYTIQSLPEPANDQLRIPFHIETTEAGTFTLDWTLPESHQVSAAYYLRDNQNGEVFELNDGNTYSFEVTEEQTVYEKQPDRFSLLLGSPVILDGFASNEKPVRSEPRFELLITTEGSDGYAGLGDLPERFTLNQNYPNPFNPTTVITYELPQSANVRLEVYDMAGRQVATLVSGQVAAGRHTINFDASNLSSGVYLYRLQAGSSVQTRKLTILK